MTQRSIGDLTVALVLSAVIVYALYVLRHAWLLFYVAIVLAIMLDPPTRLVGSIHIGRWRPGRGLSVAIVAVLVLAAVVLIVLLIVPPIAGDAAHLEREWPTLSRGAIEWVHQHLPFGDTVTGETVKRWARQVTGGSPVLTIGTSLIDILTTLLIAVYLLVDGRGVFDWTLSLLPSGYRSAARHGFSNGARRMQRWVSGQGLLMLTHGGSAFLTFWILGLPYFAAVAVFAALINVIPFLGPILTLMVAGLIAAIEALGKLAGVVVFYLVYHNIESAILQPHIMSHAVGVTGVTVVMALVVGYEIAGLVGMVISVPTAVLIAELQQNRVSESPGTRHRSVAG